VPRLKFHPLPIPAKGVARVLPVEVNKVTENEMGEELIDELVEDWRR
jgi:hypothetical protein